MAVALLTRPDPRIIIPPRPKCMFGASKLLMTVPIPPPVPAFGAVGPAASGTSVSSLTWSDTAAAGAAVIVGVAWFSGTKTLSATYNGVAMTQVGSNVFDNNTTSRGGLAMFRLAGAGTGSSVSVVVSGLATATAAHANSVSYTGVTGFGTPATHFGSGASGSLSVPSATGQLVAQMFSTNGTSVAISSYNQTSRYYSGTSTSSGITVLMGDAPGASSVSFTGTMGGSLANWAAIGLPLL